LMLEGFGCSVCVAKLEGQAGSYSMDQVFIVPGKHELFCVRHKPPRAIPLYDYLRRKREP
jgi:hypothetical protein